MTTMTIPGSNPSEYKGDTADTDLRLTKYFGLSQGFFLRYQEEYELRIARRKIAAEIAKIKPITEAV